MKQFMLLIIFIFIFLICLPLHCKESNSQWKQEWQILQKHYTKKINSIPVAPANDFSFSTNNSKVKIEPLDSYFSDSITTKNAAPQ